MTDTTENKAQPKRQLHLRQKRGIMKKEFSFSQVALSLKVTQSCLTRARPFPSPGEPSPGTEPGSTALKAGFLSHQGNSNQQKKKKKKPPTKTCLPISESRVPSVGSEKSGWFICLAMSIQPSCLHLKNPILVLWILGFPCVSAGKEFAYNGGDLGSIPALGRSQQKGKANHSSSLVWKIPWTA